MNKNKMQEQMDLFGGLKDEGGKVDKKSGNKVPVGSTRKEVRDDIPAQLSEGEFVLPADVVRYHGLEKIMKLRQQAKGGLKTMEKMGQMGNAEEAIMPDDMPFRPEFQQGGAVQASAIQAPQVLQSNPVPGFQRPVVPGVEFTPAQPQQQIPSMFAKVPVGSDIPFVQQARAPQYRPPSYQEPITFKDYIGAEFGQLQKSETKRFVNDQGEELYIPFVNGKPVYPIPAGYTEFKKEAPKPEPDKPTTPTTRTRDDSDSGGDDTGTGIKTTRVSKIASDAAGGQKGIKDFFSTGKGAGIAGSVLGMSMLGPIGAIIGGLLGRSLVDNKKELAQQMGAIPGATGPLGPERDFEKLSQDAYGKSIADTATMLGGTTPTFSYGFNPGDVDVVTGGTFNAAGIAVDENGNVSSSNGVPSYASFSDFVNAMSVSANTGYYGGPVSKDEYNNMSQNGKDLYNNYAVGLGIPSYGGDDREEEPVDDSTPSPTDPTGIDFGVKDPTPAPAPEPPSYVDPGLGDDDPEPDPTPKPEPPSYVDPGLGDDDPEPEPTPEPEPPSYVDPGLGDDNGNDNGNDPGNDPGSSKIICTAMNKMYGLPMYSNRVWMRYNKYKKLDSAWELGYHKIFLSLVKQMPTNKYICNTLEWFANTRTHGLKEEMKGNMFTVNTLILRPLLSPIVYITGKLIQKGILKKVNVKSI